MAARRAPLLPPAAARALPGLSTEQQALLNDMLDGYRAWRGSRGHKRSSVDSDEATVVEFLCHAGGIPGQVLPSDFERWSDGLWRERGLAASTQRKYQTAVRVFFDYVLREPRYRNQVRQALGADIVQVSTPENSVIHLRVRELEHEHDRRAFTEAQTLQLLGSLEREIGFAWRSHSKSLVSLQRDKALFSAMLEMGLRADEALGLNLDSFEPNPDFPELGRWGLVRVYGKGGKWRTVVVLDPALAEALKWYEEKVRPKLEKKAAAGEQAFFLAERGRRMSYSALYRQYCKARDLAGLPRELVPHCLRHTSISNDDLGGLSLEANRLRHGHEYGSTTQGYMHHPDEFTKSDFARVIERKLPKKQ